MQSAIAQSVVFSGSAVSVSGDTASLASATVLATHIATLGAAPRGIVSVLANGNVTLDDWSLASGSSSLQTGKTYFAGNGGKLVTSGGQPVGIAISAKTLSVTIQSAQVESSGATAAQLAAINAAISSLQSQIDVLENNLPASSNASYASLAQYGEF